MKKIQSEVMRRAWEIKEDEEIQFSSALKQAWEETKTYINRNKNYIKSLKSGIDKMSVYVLSAFGDNKKIYQKGIDVIEENIEKLESFFENKYIKNVYKNLKEVFNYIARRKNNYFLNELEKLVSRLENKDEVINFKSEYENLIYYIENNKFLQEEAKSFKNRIFTAVANRKIKFTICDRDVTEDVLEFIRNI